MRLSYLYLLLLVLCFYSCNRNQSLKHPITENNQETVSSDTLPLGGGAIATGTSSIIYQDDESKITVKKIAEIRPSVDGGVDLSALYLSVNNAINGYSVNGICGYSRVESEYLYDTLFVSKDFLESDCFDIYDYQIE